MMSKNCMNCAWYCHADGKCYGNSALLRGLEIGKLANVVSGCRAWAFDGLEEWEREDTLVTMEMVK